MFLFVCVSCPVDWLSFSLSWESISRDYHSVCSLSAARRCEIAGELDKIIGNVDKLDSKRLISFYFIDASNGRRNQVGLFFCKTLIDCRYLDSNDTKPLAIEKHIPCKSDVLISNWDHWECRDNYAGHLSAPAISHPLIVNNKNLLKTSFTRMHSRQFYCKQKKSSPILGHCKVRRSSAAQNWFKRQWSCWFWCRYTMHLKIASRHVS